MMRATRHRDCPGAQMKQLQSKLQARGYDVGKIDGILGAGTRAAVQAEQARLGLPADAWPTAELLNQLIAARRRLRGGMPDHKPLMGSNA